MIIYFVSYCVHKVVVFFFFFAYLKYARSGNRDVQLTRSSSQKIPSQCDSVLYKLSLTFCCIALLRKDEHASKCLIVNLICMYIFLYVDGEISLGFMCIIYLVKNIFLRYVLMQCNAVYSVAAVVPFLLFKPCTKYMSAQSISVNVKRHVKQHFSMTKPTRQSKNYNQTKN